MGGRRASHRLLTRKPRTAAATSTITAIFSPLNKPCWRIFVSLFLHEIVVDGLQSAPEVKHGVVFAREQRGDAYASLRSYLFEAAARQFMCNEDPWLRFGQLLDCILHRFAE